MKHFHVFRMKSFHILLVAIVLLFCTGCQKDPLQTEDQATANLQLKGAKVNNLVVIAKSETLPEGFEAQLSAYGQIVNSTPEIGIVTIQPYSTDSENKIATLEGVAAVVPDLSIKWVEPVQSVNLATKPTKTAKSSIESQAGFSYQWGLEAVKAPQAWNAGFKGKKVRVFILDSGIDAEHPDLATNLNTALCKSFVPGENYNIQSGFYFNHGTHVAGIVAALDNQTGVTGVAPEAEIVAVKVLSEVDGEGSFSGINAGIVYAANNGANVINMSLGAIFSRNGFYIDATNQLGKYPAVYLQNLILAQQRAVNYAFRKGAVIVVSAGNDGLNGDGDASLFRLPAELQNVVAVSATAPNYWYQDLTTGVIPQLDFPASYTDFGKSLIDIAAPGGDFDYAYNLNWHWDMVLSTISEGYGWAAGTSMASPHVAGVAALIIGKNGGSMSPQAVTQQLLKTADLIGGNGVSAYYGKGRVNAFRAVTE